MSGLQGTNPGSTSKQLCPHCQDAIGHTRYMDMLLERNEIHAGWNLGSTCATWILLAGYIVFPATFNKFQADKSLDQKLENELAKEALGKARNWSLSVIAAVFCAIGVAACFGLWFKWRRNYQWVVDRIFFPAFVNSIAGLVSTLVNVYTAQKGQFSVTAKATVIVTSICSAVNSGLFLWFNNAKLNALKREHEKIMARVGAGRDGMDRQVRMVDEEMGGLSEARAAGGPSAGPGRMV